jgi:hypothetical protein
MATLRSRLKDVDGDQQTVLRTAMIAIAHADGIIKTEEVAGIEKVYQILGLDPRLSTLICMLAKYPTPLCGSKLRNRGRREKPSQRTFDFTGRGLMRAGSQPYALTQPGFFRAWTNLPKRAGW